MERAPGESITQRMKQEDDDRPSGFAGLLENRAKNRSLTFAEVSGIMFTG
jgi:hypothetical protein